MVPFRLDSSGTRKERAKERVKSPNVGYNFASAVHNVKAEMRIALFFCLKCLYDVVLVSQIVYVSVDMLFLYQQV